MLNLTLTEILTLSYILAINLFSFILFGVDKAKAKYGSKMRISEFMLLTFSLIGGSFGSIIAMKTFHHKTRKNSFKYKFGIILFLNILAYAYVLYLYMTL